MAPIRPAYSTRLLAGFAALPLALTMSACSIGIGGGHEPAESAPTDSSSPSESSKPTGSAPNGQKSDTKDQDDTTASAAQAGRIDTSTVIEPKDVTLKDHKYRVDLNAVTVKDGLTTVTMTVVNTDATEAHSWWTEFDSIGEALKRMQLFDTENRLVYKPGKIENTSDCLCSRYTSADHMRPGDSRTLFTTFEALPESTTSITVDWLPIQAPFENVPVTRK